MLFSEIKSAGKLSNVLLEQFMNSMIYTLEARSTE